MPDSPRLRQVSIITSAEAEDLASVLLEREGDQTPSVYSDAATGLSTVSIYLELMAEATVDLRRRLRIAVREASADEPALAQARIQIHRVVARDWSESWKRHFRPIVIGDALLVKPTWSRRPARKGQQVVLLDPGLSFGTGQHPTTHFCLMQVAALRMKKPLSLLDLGCGSGILAIAAVKLGYAPVAAWDHDPDCVRICAENVHLNSISAQLTPELHDLTAIPTVPSTQYDVVCANLIHDLLIAEHHRISELAAPGGSLVLSGILNGQFPAVESAYAELGWHLAESVSVKEWTSGVFRRS